MAREIQIPAREIPAQTHRYRTSSITIATPEGGPYVLTATRERITLENGIEVKRETVQGAPIRREFNPSGEGMTADEGVVFAKLSAAIDAYAAADGEGQ
jgi:hypothetical protein